VEFERFDSNLNTGYVQSGNFDAGTTGWRIDGNGNAEFNDVTVRGNLGASNIVGTIKMLDGDIESGETTVLGPLYTLSNTSLRFVGVDGNDRSFVEIDSDGLEARVIDSVNPGVGASIVRVTPDEIRFGSTQNLTSSGIHDNLKVIKEFDPSAQGGGGDIVRMSLENNSSFKVVDANDENSVDVERGKLSISNGTGEKIEIGVDSQGLPSINIPENSEFRFYSGSSGYPFQGGQALFRVDDDAFDIQLFTSLQTSSSITSSSFRGGDVRTTNGSASFPAYRFGSDLDTGIYRVGADHIGLSTNGVSRLEVDADGDVEAKRNLSVARQASVDSLNLATIALADLTTYEQEGTMIILEDPGISKDLRIYSDGAWRIIHTW